jgi:hypothetical protein
MVTPVYTPIHILNTERVNNNIAGLGNALAALQMGVNDREARQEERRREATQQAEAARKAESERQESARKYVSNVLTTLDPQDPEFATKWKGHLDYLRKAGHNVEPEYDDPQIGYNLALAEVTDAKTRGKWTNERRDDELRGREIDLREREADDKALSRNRRDLMQAVDVMQRAQTPEQWQAAQPTIQLALGRPVPFSERNTILAQAQSASSAGDPFTPTVDEERLGITRQMKMDAGRAERLNKMFGAGKQAKPGYRYTIENGQVRQVPTTEKQQQIQKQKNTIDFHVNSLADAEEKLLRANLAQRAFGQVADYGEQGQAAADWENAVLGLVYERSGKQTAVAEMERWLKTYGPKPLDSEERVKAKIQRVRDYYEALTGEKLPERKSKKDRLKSKYGLE